MDIFCHSLHQRSLPVLFENTLDSQLLLFFKDVQQLQFVNIKLSPDNRRNLPKVR
jgi:hypothetical protein